MGISRREFIGTAGVALAASQTLNAAGMPTRKLGKTGATVSILAFGSGSRFLEYDKQGEDKALEALNKALDLGISYVDTAYAYGNGRSEELVGKVMAKRRKEVFLATKVSVRGGDEAMRIIEGSFKRLQSTPDLIHIHSLTTPDDLAAIEAKDGVLARLEKLRSEKAVKFIGITCHTDPAVLKTALERHDFNVTQMALNAALMGMAKADGSFESIALPVAVKKNMGIIAMKIFGQDRLSGKAPHDKLISYSLSLPVSACVLGMPKLQFIEQNIAVAKSFKPLAPQEMKDISQDLSSRYKASIDRHFMDHVDA